MFLERYGILIGIVLLVTVSVWAFLLALKAARGVAQFREEHHERFNGAPKL